MGVLTLVRHGQASFMSDDYDKLSPLGERQAHVLGQYWVGRRFKADRVYCGPLARQKRTAELVAQSYAEAGLEWPEVTELEALAEFPVETLAKKYLPELIGESPALAQKIMELQASESRADKERLFMEAFEVVTDHWIAGRFNGGAVESWETFTARVEDAVKTMTAAAGHGNQIVAFTSAGPMAVSTRMALNAASKAAMDLAWVIRNAALTEFRFSDRGVMLDSFNVVSHLDDAELITHR